MSVQFCASSNLSRFETTTILIQHESSVQITPTSRNPKDNFCPPAKLSQSAQGSCRPTGALMPPVPAVATSCRFNDFIAAIPTIYPQSLKILMATYWILSLFDNGLYPVYHSFFHNIYPPNDHFRPFYWGWNFSIEILGRPVTCSNLFQTYFKPHHLLGPEPIARSRSGTLMAKPRSHLCQLSLTNDLGLETPDDTRWIPMVSRMSLHLQ